MGGGKEIDKGGVQSERVKMWEQVWFFFFKQKTAYEISACLVGSEMCVRDGIMSQRLNKIIPKKMVVGMLKNGT